MGIETEILPEWLRIPYLECKNEIQLVEITVNGKIVKIQLPICPQCQQPIEGWEYFQSSLQQPRFHMDCFFENCHANAYYRKEFFKDTMLPKINSERRERWFKYLAENQQ
jgi:hypothetical protein